MNIAVLGPSHVPFMWGGMEGLTHGLAHHLNSRTPHRAELLRIPSPELSLQALVGSYRMWAELDVSSFDLVISLKYPTWMVEHPRHVVWMAHRLRGLYDTYPGAWPLRQEGLSAPVAEARRQLHEACERGASTRQAAALAQALVAQALAHQPEVTGFPSPLAREVVHALDDLALRPQRIARYAALAQAVVRRPGYFPAGVDVHILHPPPLETSFTPGPAGPAFFTASRLDGPKRLDLVVRAFRRSAARGPLRIAGTGPEAGRLRTEAEGDSRIELLGFISAEELRRQYSQARAVVFTPQDEDFGYVALEAQLSGKAVITTTDSGGPCELVEHERSGLVVHPDEASLAAAFERLDARADLAEQYGRRGLRRAASTTWQAVVPWLLGQQAPRAPRPFQSRRRRMVVTVPFPISPVSGGGRVRVYEFYRRLAQWMDVDLLCFDASGNSAQRQLAPGLREVVVGASEQHRQRETALSGELGWIPLTDVALPLLAPCTPALAEQYEALVARADLQVACHPFLAPLMQPHAAHVPLVYEAQDIEIELKEGVFASQPGARPLLEATEHVERWCLEHAALTLVCSQEDGERFVQRYGTPRERLLLVANGVDDECTPYVGAPQRRAAQAALGLSRPCCVFMGSWHPPNLEAAKLLLAAARELPEVDFVLIGNLDGYFRAHPVPPNVRFTGFVSFEQKLQLLHTADLALNPMRYGTGTNLKLLDYAAAGVPVLSTPMGLRGLAELRPAVLVAELPGFTQAIGEALARPLEERGDTALARQVVEQRYGWRSIAQHAWESLRPLVG